jgi:small subunit ribosomal protein S12
MTTLYNLAKLNLRKKKIKKNKKILLNKCPQKKGTCILVFKGSPKKPNSAKRKLTKVSLIQSKKKIICHIPGEGHNLQSFSTVLIKGAYLRDLP